MTRIFAYLSPTAAGAFLMITAGALFAVVNTLVQYGAMVQSIAPSRLAFWQYLIAFLFAVPWLLSRNASALRTNVIGQHITRVILAAIGVQFWVWSLAYVPIWQAIALIMLSPFFVTLGAGLVLRETISLQRWSAVLVGFVGGMIILAPWSDAFSIHAILPVCAAAFWAFSSLMTKKMTTSESPATLTLYLLLLLTPINAFVVLGDGLALNFGLSGVLLLAIGILTALAQYALVKAYSLTDAAYLQPFDHVKLPFNVVLGLIVFGYAPPGAMWLGATLIVGASFALLHREARLCAR